MRADLSRRARLSVGGFGPGEGSGRESLGEGDCEGIVPGLRDDDIVEWFIAFAEAGEADFEDHCLHASIL